MYLGIRTSVAVVLWLLILPRMRLILFLSAVMVTIMTVILALIPIITGVIRKIPTTSIRLPMLVGLWGLRG